jgi:DnaJ domain
LSTELDRAYEVLGVKPGVSDRELKAAHRDLAKVWHPDRFGHDPRLQEKAQEKLKEINEAYEQLISRHKRRVTPTPPPRRSRHAPEPVRVAVKKGIGWHWWIAVPFAVFALVFAFTVKTLVREPQPQPAASVESAQLEEPTEQAPTTTTRPDASHTVRNRDDNNLAPAPETPAESASTNEPVVAVPTVTVSIDPESGQLATPACPVKSRMTYPSGSEPRGYCNINHAVKPEKKTGLKGLAKRISEID